MFRQALIIAALLLVSFAAIADESKDVKPSDGISYIIQANSLDIARSAVLDAGGDITHELKIINAVGAVLSKSQYEELSADSRLDVQLESAAGFTDAANADFSALTIVVMATKP